MGVVVFDKNEWSVHHHSFIKCKTTQRNLRVIVIDSLTLLFTGSVNFSNCNRNQIILFTNQAIYIIPPLSWTQFT